MFCVYTTLQALKLFCSVESAQGHCLFLTCLYTTQGVMTSRIVWGCRHEPAHYLYFSGSQLTLNTNTTHWPGPLHAFKHSNSCQHATASGKEEIGYYAKPFLSSCGIQTHNYYHIMPFFEKTLGRMHQKLVHESCFLTKCWCLLMFLWGTYFNLWLHRMSPLECPGWIGKQSAEGEERRREEVVKES